MTTTDNVYSFNHQDYELTIRLTNGVNDIYLSNEAWDDLYIEEDIFDWFIRGSIIIKANYESFERESDEALFALRQDKTKLVYKFRNDCRDTLFISIKPKTTTVLGEDYEFEDKKWRLEAECVIYDVEDMGGATNAKTKKLFFWEKTYQLMRERDLSYSTANSGGNKSKANLDQLDNSEKSLPTGEAIKELLVSAPEFENIVDDSTWDMGDAENTIFYSTPPGTKMIDSLGYLLKYHTSSADTFHQPCILKYERADKTMSPKKFSLKPIQKYFELAGTNNPKEYQIEHFFIEEFSENDKVPFIKKSPISNDPFSEIKGDRTNSISSYKLADLRGIDYSENLTNYRIVSYNSAKRQFNEEANIHKAEEYKSFYRQSIRNNILTKNSDDRLVLTPYISDGINTRTIFSTRKDSVARLAEGRNKLINYYLFNNLAISFSTNGITARQPGRFFALSKLTGNDKEFDGKLEGQYFVVNIVHHFNNAARNYQTLLTGVKVHTYKEETTFESSDVTIIK